MKIRRYTFSARLSILVLLIYGIAAAGCKKAKKEEAQPEPEPVVTPKSSRAELSADSMFFYAKEVYLWNEMLPTYEIFNPRQYVNSDEEAGLNNELFAITRYAKKTSGQSYEYYEDEPSSMKYSYVFNTDNENPVAFVAPATSSVDLEGNGYDIGIRPGYYGTETSYSVYVVAVYQNSPAEKAGIERGDVISSINGRSVGTNFDVEYSLLDDTFYGTASSVALKGTKRNGSPLNVVLSAASYRSSPVYCDSVYQAGAKKIGYLSYARFSNSSNSVSALDDVFSKFASENVTDLIIDFRYNGGGYVTTAEHLINLIAPSSANGQIMFTEHFNSMMQSGKAPILAKQPVTDANGNIVRYNGRIRTLADEDFSVAKNTSRFSKQGALAGVSNVVFIVSRYTASASELVINSLKPYMNVKIVGEQTYGKPVGFFPITIDKYDVYFSMFESKNSQGEGGYYDGFIPHREAADNPRFEFGNLQENSLKTAYAYLSTGDFPVVASTKTSSVSGSGGSVPKLMEDSGKKVPRREFRGMIETRHKIR